MVNVSYILSNAAIKAVSVTMSLTCQHKLMLMKLQVHTSQVGTAGALAPIMMPAGICLVSGCGPRPTRSNWGPFPPAPALPAALSQEAFIMTQI